MTISRASPTGALFRMQASSRRSALAMTKMLIWSTPEMASTTISGKAHREPHQAVNTSTKSSCRFSSSPKA